MISFKDFLLTEETAINTKKFKSKHKKDPSGKKSWEFILVGKNKSRKVIYRNIDFKEAKKRIRKEASKMGVRKITLIP